MKHQSKDLCPTEWEMVSDLLDGQELPESINEQIYGLRDGTHVVVSVQEVLSTLDRFIFYFKAFEEADLLRDARKLFEKVALEEKDK